LSKPFPEYSGFPCAEFQIGKFDKRNRLDPGGFKVLPMFLEEG